MKTLRLIGMALVAIVMSVNFAACSDDDDDDKSGDAASLVGKWKIGTVTTDGVTEEWDGHPYIIFTETHFYFTNDEGTTKSDYCTYTYNKDTKEIHGVYVNSPEKIWDMTVVKLTATDITVELEEEHGEHIIVNAKRVK